jgi:cell division protein ZipA
VSVLQWILLASAIAAVVAFYLRIRRRDEDPWRSEGAEDPEGLPDVTTGKELQRPVIIDPAVAEEVAATGEPVADDGGSSWEHFRPKPDPQLGLEIAAATPGARQRTVAAPPGQEKIIALHIAAKGGHAFAGPAIHNALQLNRLRFGMHDIYHRITEVNGVPEAVFSVASMVKPGQLDPAAGDRFTTPGLTLFMVMPGPLEGAHAFRDMLDTANRLAQRLGGEVLDDKRSQMTHQTEQYVFDQIAEMERRWRVPSRGKK